MEVNDLPPDFDPRENLYRVERRLLDTEHALEVARWQHEESQKTLQSKLGRWLAPSGSWRERAIHKVVSARKFARSEGIYRTLRHTVATVARKMGLLRRPTPPLPEPVEPPQKSALDRKRLMDEFESVLIRIKDLEAYETRYRLSAAVMAESHSNPGPNYVPRLPAEDRVEDPAVKAIAFYLPQFHPFKENNEWWGVGFTEWTNVSKAIPKFVDHYQPHLPGDLGFYDLRVPQVMEQQVDMARQYGIHGFAFYHYWFAGKRLLERPLDSFVANPNIDFPFCLIWANENWSRRWDGQEADVLMAQVHTPETDLEFIRDLMPYVKHPNYIKVQGRPLIMVYRLALMPDPAATAKRWREYCIAEGVGDPYLVAAQTFGFEDPEPCGFDAAVQFPPHNGLLWENFALDTEHLQTGYLLDKGYEGTAYSYPKLVAHKLAVDPPPSNVYEAAFPMWDNASRRHWGGATYAYCSPALYKMWLQKICERALNDKGKAEPMVFINAWNEWAEGTHLEPDRRYGFGFLQATKDALEYAKRLKEGVAVSDKSHVQADPELAQFLVDKPKSPIVIYQMGKVGSISMADALGVRGRCGLFHVAAEQSADGIAKEIPVVHAHVLADLDAMEERVSKALPEPRFALQEIGRSKQIVEWMNRADDETVWNVITMVREPVARNIAAFFQNIIEVVPDIEARYRANDIGVNELHEIFLHTFNHKISANWFNHQFKPVFGIDVLAEPFDFELRYKIYRKGNTRVLLLRTEDRSASVGPAMEEFLGIKDFKDRNVNTSEDKFLADLIAAFKEKPLPHEYCEAMYSTPFAKHFYTRDDIYRYALRWRGG